MAKSVKLFFVSAQKKKLQPIVFEALATSVILLLSKDGTQLSIFPKQPDLLVFQQTTVYIGSIHKHRPSRSKGTVCTMAHMASSRHWMENRIAEDSQIHRASSSQS